MQLLQNATAFNKWTISIVCVGIVLFVIQAALYKFRWWKIAVIILTLTYVGNFGARFVSYLQTEGRWGAERLYGDLIFVAPAILLLSVVLKIPWCKIGDAVVWTWCSVFIAGKVRCLIYGCCYGRIVFENSDFIPMFRFPSQIFEIVSLAVITLYLLMLKVKKMATGALFPAFMVLYGISRYIADWFRGNPSEWEPFFFYMPAGRFFSLLNVVIGFVMLYILLREKLRRKVSIKEVVRAGIAIMPEDYPRNEF